GFVPALLDPKPVQDVSAITFLGQEITEKHPIVKSWIMPSPARVNLDSLATYAGPYRPLRRLGLSSVYPIVEGYKDAAAVGLKLELSDPYGIDVLDLSSTVTPSSSLDPDERVHLTAGFKHFGWTAQAKWNSASFYDLVGPTKVGRKGYSAGLTYKHPFFYDPPRTFDMTLSGTGYGGLEVLPDAQNVETAPGFDKLVTASALLAFRNVRSSIGAADAERGYKWQLHATTNLVRYETAGHGAWRNFPLGYGTLDVGTPLPMPHSALWLRTAAGYSPGDRADPFANFFFGGFGNNWVDYQDPKRYRDYASFPGVELDEIAGTNFTKATLDWNLPPIRFRGVGNPAFYASYVRASVFTTGLVTNLDSASDRVTAGNLGAQADLKFTVLVQHPFTLSVGYARAFGKNRPGSDETMVSLKIL
ncbi:MAG TPA: hypothetical protein VN539_08300, partial [Candidatus Saccharimonadales bacterium]|nr:hypothetical protein [Candidatus Saccharimonadales bacterium]